MKRTLRERNKDIEAAFLKLLPLLFIILLFIISSSITGGSAGPAPDGRI